MIKHYKPNAAGIPNGTPVAVYDVADDKLIGEYDSYAKAMRDLTGRTRSLKIIDVLVKGKPKTTKIRTGQSVYFKSIKNPVYKKDHANPSKIVAGQIKALNEANHKKAKYKTKEEKEARAKETYRLKMEKRNPFNFI